VLGCKQHKNREVCFDSRPGAWSVRYTVWDGGGKHTLIHAIYNI
jgi:hypothetical protein